MLRQSIVRNAKSLVVLMGWFALCFILSGCMATVDVADTIPEQVKQTFDTLHVDEGIALTFIPRPEGEQVQIDLGAVEYSLNRLFEGMVTELIQTKFGDVNRASKNKLTVAISYINLEERNWLGGAYLNRIDMAVDAKIANGPQMAEQEFAYSAESDREGYSVRTDQIYNLLLKFIVTIDELIDSQMMEQ